MPSVSLIKSNSEGFSLQLNFRYNNSMLQGEEDILEVINEAGGMATRELLERFDTDGLPLQKGSQKFTSKGLADKNYQTPYGTIRVSRNIYQTQFGGKTYCPLEEKARIVITSTPRFAKMISSKYSQMAVTGVKKDLINNHGRNVQKKLIQDVSEAVGSIIEAKEDHWEYDLPEFDEKVEGISVGLDGTCMLMKDDGWREAMAGTISLYNKDGDKMHTVYSAAPPEYGKEKFLKRFEKEVLKVKNEFPNVFTLGLADGSKENWSFLNKHTDDQLLDFYHASGYVGSAGQASKTLSGNPKNDWIEKSCHRLKHKKGGASRVLSDISSLKDAETTKKSKDVIQRSITYFENNKDKMNYYKYVNSQLPIGSGATEAACKVIIKQRMCQSGMRWRNDGAQIVLLTRSLHETAGQWDQFWGKVDQYGFNIAS